LSIHGQKATKKFINRISINTYKHKYKNITTSVLGVQLESCIHSTKKTQNIIRLRRSDYQLVSRPISEKNVKVRNR